MPEEQLKARQAATYRASTIVEGGGGVVAVVVAVAAAEQRGAKLELPVVPVSLFELTALERPGVVVRIESSKLESSKRRCR